MREDVKKFISSVSRPGRYTGGERGCVLKTGNAVDLRVAFCFPDSYEIGMSNLGMRILCAVLNDMDRVLCERVYAPWPDMEEKMREAGVPLFTLDSGDAVGDFDIVAFTMQYELCYTNVLNMMGLAGIPLRSRDRGESDPVIIAGGPCSYNPEPMAPFVDIFSIGEGEEALPELAALYLRMKDDGSYTKEKFLRAAATELDGFYVPSLYEPSYNEDGTLASFEPLFPDVPRTVTKRVIADLDTARVPLEPVMPFVETVHDRVTLEVFRGCIRGCRFCQAGFVCRPVRERSPEVLSEQARAMCAWSGYDEISLSSLSISDYSKIGTLTDRLLTWTDEEKINLSLPSLRADSFTPELMEKVSSVRTSAVTFAPEAGSQRLRDVINKNVTEEEILNAAGVAYNAGKSKIKLYFMNGLPGETYDDIAGIAELAHKVVDKYYRCENRNRRQQPQVTLSVACFIPKPHTPFQWEGQNTFEELEEKQRFLLSKITDRKVRYNYHDAKVSHIEAVFARGDRRLADAIEEAVRRGMKFDAWDEFFDFDGWMSVFSDCSLDPAFYACRTIPDGELLPWDMIDSGVDKSFLLRERRKAYEAATTPSCREKCSGCGANGLVPAEYCRWCPGHGGGEDAEDIVTGAPIPRRAKEENVHLDPVRAVRIRFSKGGATLYVSHLDLAKTMTRAIRRSGIPVWFSEGFNPIPRLVFASSLSVGCAGEREVLDIKIVEEMSDEEIKERLRAAVPPGIEILEVYTKERKLTDVKWAENLISFFSCALCSDLPEKIGELFRGPVVVTKRSKSGERDTDISPLIKSLSARIDGSVLTVSAITGASDSAYLNPELIARAIEREFSVEGTVGYHSITRKKLLLEDGITEFR
ncbi:MAG: TIGR03960 family B12-binding radical SAM protein [Clostridia bacterium]|nr:TIGR03960 family B12-binding radical SAM protein [Clostridia bacterium]